MRRKHLFLSVIALLAILSAKDEATAQIPRNLSIQGVLTDSTSKPVQDGIHTITLRLYDKLIGGNVVYTEEYTTPIFKGLFNLTLGSKSPLPASIVFDKQYFVGISYDGHSEIARIPLSSVPYSIMAETVPDGSITTSKIADGSITPEKLSFDFRSEKKANAGLANSATGTFAFIGGGNNNIASGNYSSVIGGLTNKAQGTYSTASGGNGNTASASYSTVSGGISNTASGANSVISGGYSNTVNAANAVIGGGLSNDVTGVYSVVSGGTDNNVSGTYSTIAGGRSNTVSSSYSGVLGGYSNLVSSPYGAIVMGYDNTVAGDHSVVLGGYGLTLTSDADRTLGFLANSGSRTMIISEPMVTVLGNTDLWIASNDGTTRALKLFSNNLNASGAFPSTVAKNIAIKAPDTLSADYTLTLPFGAGTPGQILTTDGTGVLSWGAAGASGSAGGDLTGTYPNPQIASGVIINSDINASAAIDYSKLNLSGGITDTDINAAAGIAYSKLSLANSIVNADLTTNSVTTSKIADGSIVTSKMADSAISGLKLLTKAVQTGHLNDNAVNGTKIALGSDATGDIMYYDGIDYVRLPIGSSSDVLTVSGGIPAWGTGGATGAAGGDLTGTYPNPTIANDAVTSAKILDGTIVNGDINGSAGIVYSKLNLVNSIQNIDIVANAITTSKVANGTVTTSKLADSAVSGLKLLTKAVTTGHINDNAVNGTKIAMGSDATGDILYYNGTDYTRLAAASNGTVLTLASGVPSWTNALVNFTESVNTATPNTTVPVVQLLATNAATDVDIALAPKGAGALSGQIADNTTTGGNKRGQYAVDWQRNRTTNTQVASGTNSTLSGGLSNRASGSYSTISGGQSNISGGYSSAVGGGRSNSTPGNYSFVGGGQNNTTSGDYSAIAGGRGLTLDVNAHRSFGFNGNTSASDRDITVDTANTTVLNNVNLWLTNNDNTPRSLRFYEQYNTAGTYPNGTNYVGFKAPASIASDVTWTLPNSDGASGEVLTTNGSGLLSWGSGTSGAAGGDLTGTYPNPTIANDAVTSAKILDGTIVNADINGSAAIVYSKLNLVNSLQNADIVANAITTSKVANGTVTTSKLADSAVSGLKLLTNAVTTGHINDNAVTSTKISDGTIVDADISGTAAIVYSKLNLVNSIQNADLVSNSVTTSKVANGTVITSKLGDSSVTGLKILTKTVLTGHINDGAITTVKIADNNVTGAKIAMGSDATGDIMYYDGTDYTRRAIGSNGDVLTVSGGVPTWSPPSGGGGGSTPIFARRTSTLSVTSDYPNFVDVLSINLEAGKTYKVEVYLAGNRSGATNAVGACRMFYTGNATTDLGFYSGSALIPGTSLSNSASFDSNTPLAFSMTANAGVKFDMYGYLITSTAGTLTLQTCRNSTNTANDFTVREGTFMIATPVN